MQKIIKPQGEVFSHDEIKEVQSQNLVCDSTTDKR